jgi:hypothetical protein
MNERDLKRLSRGDLLEMLVAQGEELEAIKAKLTETEEKLQKKEMDITEAGIDGVSFPGIEFQPE